ncbi:hypothetical protein JOC77_000276 [Peribacillus deserti]|uniref:Uncharacterized protein n=1 Tax=Peribacillus deserti TaxID=673318 RepID=A0ABS2QCI4_9BACI|nr:hypothetical protein [Peribacillus deserti]MBM7690873.1 hypothetical protein [Peribacillus deserti]
MNSEITPTLPYETGTRLTRNELKDILDDSISSFKDLSIKVAEQNEVKLSKVRATNILLDGLNKHQLVDIINQLYLINQRNSNEISFLKFILTGLLSEQSKQN